MCDLRFLFLDFGFVSIILPRKIILRVEVAEFKKRQEEKERDDLRSVRTLFL
jgi:hypothetical protein